MDDRPLVSIQPPLPPTIPFSIPVPVLNGLKKFTLNPANQQTVKKDKKNKWFEKYPIL
jgi:hypothetical protein